MLPTIFASATPPGRSALSVLRIAGPEAFSVLRRLTQAPKTSPGSTSQISQISPVDKKPHKVLGPPHRKARLTKLFGNDNRLLDEALVLAFHGPHSYTGEDIVELYLHGSPVVSRAVQQAVLATGAARHAEPGEFTRRAFQNGQLDLTQVEGIRDLLAAETETQRRAAVLGATGAHTQRFGEWRTQLVKASAMLAAAIDFAEDNHLEESVDAELRASLAAVRADVALALQQSAASSEIVRDGLRVALLGAPNAGKSSLTNRLVQRAAALVSDVPGTTRDVLEVSLEVHGHRVVLIDTAGLREAEDTVEKLGVQRAREVLAEAHIVVALFPKDSKLDKNIEQEVYQLEQSGKTVLRVASKADLSGPNGPPTDLDLSAMTGAGIDTLLNRLAAEVDAMISAGTTGFSDEAAGLSVRAQGLLRNEVLPGLDGCLDFLDVDVVLASAEAQRAIDAIGAITGEAVSVHEVLDVVFGEFCIGK